MFVQVIEKNIFFNNLIIDFCTKTITLSGHNIILIPPNKYDVYNNLNITYSRN